MLTTEFDDWSEFGRVASRVVSAEFAFFLSLCRLLLSVASGIAGILFLLRSHHPRICVVYVVLGLGPLLFPWQHGNHQLGLASFSHIPRSHLARARDGSAPHRSTLTKMMPTRGLEVVANKATTHVFELFPSPARSFHGQ
jgi:hypothetical protein